MAEPSHWIGVGRKRTTEDDKPPGSDHSQCPYRPISGTAMEISVYTFLRYPWSSDQNKNKQTNSSLRSGGVPSQWNQAVMVPLPKVVHTPSLDKLRPISLTSTLCKVCETFVTGWMLQDMDSTLDCAQCGNRKGRSNTHYLVELVRFMLKEAEVGRFVKLLAIDFSKVFDKVDVTLIMQRLLDMDVRPELLPWIADFLTDRKQCVRHGRQMEIWGWHYYWDSCHLRASPNHGTQPSMDNIIKCANRHMSLNVHDKVWGHAVLFQQNPPTTTTSYHCPRPGCPHYAQHDDPWSHPFSIAEVGAADRSIHQ